MTVYLKMVLSFFYVLFLVVLLNSAEPAHQNSGLRKTAIDDPLLNRARAYLDKGKLKIAVENYGIFSGTASPQGLWGDFQYISNLSLVVGIPGKNEEGSAYPWAVGAKEVFFVKDQDFKMVGDDTTYWGPTVSESWFDRTENLNRTDWESVDDARFRLHNPLAIAGDYYGKLGLYTNVEDQYPLIATSDIPETWPGDEDERNWPGPWAADPADTSGQTIMEDVFVSDQDIYFEFDDRMATRDVDPYQGYPIGIRAKVSGFSYGASISEDIAFFKMTLHNESPYTYEDIYAGFYYDVDSYNRLANGSYAGRTNDDDMMGYDTEYDFGFIYDLDGDQTNPYVRGKKLAYSAVKLLETPAATEDIDLDADGFTDIVQGENLGLTSWHWFDWYFRPGARDVHPTQGPWSGDGQTPIAENSEEIQYKIIAGDTSSLTAYDSTHYFHPARSEVGYGKLNPRFDSVEGLLYEYEEGLDCVFIMGSGPFRMAPGDSVPFSFCIIMGEDEGDLRTNARIAQLMYDNNYQGARPPKAPNVIAKEDDRKISLYWDDVSLKDKDIITGYQDFEGFQIYRSEDNGQTWGEKITDSRGQVVGYVPLAIYDLDNDILLKDKYDTTIVIANNSGLEYVYEDTDVQNGREYLYAVCAYDRGFIPHDPIFDPDDVATSKSLNFVVPVLQNFLSNSTKLSHIVKAVPHRPASNSTQSELAVERKEGNIGNGVFTVEVINPSQITGDNYEITFDCDYSDPPDNKKIVAGSQKYSIRNLTKGDTIVYNSQNYSIIGEDLEAPPVFDGLSWGIRMSKDIQIAKEDAEWGKTAQCNYDLFTATMIALPYFTRSNYEIRFIGNDAETVYGNLALTTEKFKAPFEVWNTVTGLKAKLLNLANTSFVAKAQFFVCENQLPEDAANMEYKRTWQFSLNWEEPPPGEAPKYRDWAPGDTLFVPVRKPFERGDGFVISTASVFQIHDVTKDDLKKIKVVPNPYLVRAGWESDYFVRRIQFTNLPDNCKIHIFTVSGEKVITLDHQSTFDGSENWDILTQNRQEAAPGLYVYVVEAANGKTHTGKFVIIK